MPGGYQSVAFHALPTYPPIIFTHPHLLDLCVNSVLFWRLRGPLYHGNCARPFYFFKQRKTQGTQ